MGDKAVRKKRVSVYLIRHAGMGHGGNVNN